MPRSIACCWNQLPRLCIAMCLCLAAACFGQVAVSPEGKDSTQGVYVRDSAVAIEKLELARRMARLKDWNKSADVYQEILEKYSDRMVPSKTGDHKDVCQYSSVAVVAQSELARWPAEGLAVYRARYEDTAAAILQQASRSDLATLHRVVAIYFPTDSAKVAGLRLIDLYLEGGEFSAAAWIGDRLLAWHPNLSVEQPLLLYRTALAYHLSRDDTTAKTKLAELRTKHPRALGRVRGADVNLAESLEKELEVAAPETMAAVGDSWPMFGGSLDRARVSSAAGRLGARFFSIKLSQPSWKITTNPQQRQMLENRDKMDRATGVMSGVMPVIDRGQLFFQDNARLFAVNVESGLPLSGWAQTYAGEHNGQYFSGGWPLPRGYQLTVTVTESAVLAIMGMSERWVQLARGINDEESGKLVCLDRETGRERWTASSRQLPEGPAPLRKLRLAGSPMVVGDNVFVLGRGGGNAMQFEDCHVLCFDLNSGAYRWSCYLASASSSMQMWMGDYPNAPQTIPQMAYASGRLYVLTNLGALAAIDAYSGTIVWLNIYPRVSATNRNNAMMNIRMRMGRGGEILPLKPWQHSPVIVEGGRLFALPTDGEHLLVYDAETGTEVKRVPISLMDNADILLMASGNRVLVSGDHERFYLNWTKCPTDASAKNLGDSVLWTMRRDAPKERSTGNSWMRGRPFVTTSSLFVPLEWCLARVSMRNGMIEELYPKNATWSEEEGPGNVLVTQNHVVIAGPQRVDVYTDLEVARRRMDGELAAAPNDPEPRLRYAEVMFVAGQTELAARKLDEAISLLGGTGAMRPGPVRDRLFSDALTCATKLANRKESTAQTMDIARQFFDRAAIAASGPSQQVVYRLERAAFARRRNDAQTEVRLYQEILADEAMRSLVTIAPGSSQTTPAGDIAEKAIRELLQRDVSCYAPFEQAATEKLAIARQVHDPAKLLAVAEVYPNAKAALAAMLEAADAFEAAQNHRQASRILWQACAKAPLERRPHVLEAAARAYLAIPGGVNAAIGRLALAVRYSATATLEKPIALPNGEVLQNMTLAEALAAVKNYAQQSATQSLPDFHIPPSAVASSGPRREVKPFLPETPQLTIPDVSALISPLPSATRNDRIVTWTAGKGLRVYAAGQTVPSFNCPMVVDTPRNVAWLGRSSLAVWTHRHIFLLHSDTGAVRWQTDISRMQSLEITGVPAEEDKTILGAANSDDEALIMNGGMIMIDGQGPMAIRQMQAQRAMIVLRGQIAGAAAMVPVAPPAQIAATDGEQIAENAFCALSDRLIVGTTSGRVLAIALSNGNLLWQVRAGEAPVQRLLANELFTVARLANPSGIQHLALDSNDGKVLHRRIFGGGNGLAPVNMALSADGRLIYTLPDRLCIKDLNLPGSMPEISEMASTSGSMNFAGAGRPDQLMVVGEDILCVVSNNSQMRFVQVRSLDDGKVRQLPANRAGRLADAMVFNQQQINDWNVFLRVNGGQFYVVGSRAAMFYDLLNWRENGALNIDDTMLQPNLKDAFLGKDYFVVLDEATQTISRGMARPAPAPAGPTYRLHIFMRVTGCIEHWYNLKPTAAITRWQAMDGGLCYLTADRTLHILQGARP